MGTRIEWTAAETVPGFSYHEDILSHGDEQDLVARITAEGRWEQDFERRAQRYGYRYEYITKTLRQIVPVPDWLGKMGT
jgi:hypothetical protein